MTATIPEPRWFDTPKGCLLRSGIVSARVWRKDAQEIPRAEVWVVDDNGKDIRLLTHASDDADLGEDGLKGIAVDYLRHLRDSLNEMNLGG